MHFPDEFLKCPWIFFNPPKPEAAFQDDGDAIGSVVGASGQPQPENICVHLQVPQAAALLRANLIASLPGSAFFRDSPSASK